MMVMIPPLSVLTVRSRSTLGNMSSFLRLRFMVLSGDKGVLLLEKDPRFCDWTFRRRMPPLLAPRVWVEVE